jgi:hypothetical protein
MPKKEQVNARLREVIDPSKLDLVSPENICGAPNAEGGVCKRHAGWGTDHYGRGRCRTHGGASEDDGPKSIIERKGYLLDSLKPGAKERLLELTLDPDLLNCRSELAYLKLKLEEVIRNPDTPLRGIIALATTIIKNSKIIHEMEVGRQHYVHISVAGAIVEAFAIIGRQYVTDPVVQKQFENDVTLKLREAMRGSSGSRLAGKLIGPHITDDMARYEDEYDEGDED